jgi:hypothetical protein
MANHPIIIITSWMATLIYLFDPTSERHAANFHPFKMLTSWEIYI